MSGQQVTIAGVLVTDVDGKQTTESVSEENSDGKQAWLVVADTPVPDYVTVPASGLNYNLGAADDGTGGAAGDYLDTVTISWTGSLSTLEIYDGGNLVFQPKADLATGITSPFILSIPIRAHSKNGEWNISTGSAMRSCLCTGSFT